jgi:uncharacterized membrane protein
MQSKVKILGHPVHPILVSFPIAFYTATMLCCLVYAGTDNTFWFRVAFVANCAALVMALVASLPGLLDWLSIPTASDAKGTGFRHMVANVFCLGFFTASAVVMYTNFTLVHPPIMTNIFLTCIGFLVMLYAGFKGWRLVQTHHMGIDPVNREAIDEQIKIEKNASEIFTDGKQKTREV